MCVFFPQILTPPKGLGTWKWTLGEGDLFWKASFLVSSRSFFVGVSGSPRGWTGDGSEILRSPVEVGSWHPIIYRAFIHLRWFGLGISESSTVGVHQHHSRIIPKKQRKAVDPQPSSSYEHWKGRWTNFAQISWMIWFLWVICWGVGPKTFLLGGEPMGLCLNVRQSSNTRLLFLSRHMGSTNLVGVVWLGGWEGTLANY